jgi:hypothetical protein
MTEDVAAWARQTENNLRAIGPANPPDERYLKRAETMRKIAAEGRKRNARGIGG